MGRSWALCNPQDHESGGPQEQQGTTLPNDPFLGLKQKSLQCQELSGSLGSWCLALQLCSVQQLHYMKRKRSQHSRSFLRTYVHVQINDAHTQSSEGLLTFLDWSSCIWGSPWHSATLHFQGVFCDNLLFPNISGAPSCLPIPFLKVSLIILCHSFLSLSSPTLSWKKSGKGEEGQELWSQNHRAVESGKGLWWSACPPPWSSRTTQASCSGSFPGGFWTSPRMETP